MADQKTPNMMEEHVKLIGTTVCINQPSKATLLLNTVNKTWAKTCVIWPKCDISLAKYSSDSDFTMCDHRTGQPTSHFQALHDLLVLLCNL